MKKLIEQQIAELPELLKTKTQAEIAKIWGCSPQNITYWVLQYEKRGVVLPKHKKVGVVDKILQNNESGNQV